MALPVAQIHYAVAHARDGTIGPHAVEPDRREGHRLIGAERKRDDRRPHDVDRFLEGLAVECERVGIVAALIAGKFRAEPDDAEFTAVETGRLRRCDGKRLLKPWLSLQAPVVQIETTLLK